MDIDRKLLEHVAKTARLELTEEEMQEFLPQLQEILDSFSEIASIDTDGVEPSFQLPKMEGRMRQDVPKNPLPREDGMKNTSHKKEGYFLGPGI